MTRRLSDDPVLRGLLGPVRCDEPSELARRACARIDRRAGPGMRRGGRGGGGSQDVPDLNLYAFADFSAASHFATPNPGGEAGVGTGFLIAALIRPTALDSTNAIINVLTARSNIGLTQGHYLRMDGNGAFNFFLGADATTKGAPNPRVLASGLGQVHLVLGYLDATSMGLWLDRVKTGTGTAVVNPATYLPAVAKQTLGLWEHAAQFSQNVQILGIGAYRGLYSDAQIQDFYDAARVFGDLPDALGGVAATHHWSAKRALAGAYNPVGRKTFGIRNFSIANYTTTAAGFAGVAGAPWWVVLYDRADAPMLTGNARILAKCNGFSQGWRFYGYSTGAMYFNLFGSSPGEINVGATNLVDVGRPQVFVGVYTGSAGRLYARRQQIGADVPITFAPSSSPLYFGRDLGGSLADGMSGFGFAAGLGLPTLAQVQQVFDLIEATGRVQPIPGFAPLQLVDVHQDIEGNSGAIPAVFLDRVGTDHLTRMGTTLEVAVDVATAPPSPNVLSDNITGAAADAMSEVGQTTVRVIDPSIDGRKTFGVQGFETNLRLESAVGAGLRGSVSGHWVAWAGRIDALSNSTAGIYAESYQDTARNWILLANAANNSQILFAAGDGSGQQLSSSWSPAAGDLGLPVLLIGVHTGTALRFYKLVKGGLFAQVGSDVAVTGYGVPTGVQMTVGNRRNANFPSRNVSHFGLRGGNGIPSLGELQAFAATWDATGALPDVAGKTDHGYDLTQDTAANGGPDNGVSAVVLDRVGSDHLTRVGPDYAIGGKRGLRLMGTTSALQGGDAAANGIQAAASALTVELLIVPLAGVGTVREVLACKLGARAWEFRRQPNADSIGVSLTTATGGAVTNTTTFSGADYGTVKHLSFTYDGVTLRFYVDGVLVAGGTACTGDASSVAGAMQIGHQAGSFPCNNDVVFLGVGGGPYVATQAELAAQAVASKAAGRLVAIPGKPDSRRHNFDEDAIEQQTTLPAKCIDRMGSGDALTRLGSGLTVAQRVERTYAWETSPIQYAVDGMSASSCYQTAQGAGVRGQPGGLFWNAVALIVTSQSVASQYRLISLCGTWWIGTAGTNTFLTAVAQDSSPAEKTAATAVVSAGDVGRIQLVLLEHDGTRLRFMHKRGEIGSGSAITGFNMPVSTFRQQINSLSFPADGVQVLGTMGGLGVATVAEYQAAWDALVANDGVLKAIPGKTDSLVDVVSQVRANGGVLPNVLVDSINPANNLTMVGSSLTAAARYSRAFGV